MYKYLILAVVCLIVFLYISYKTLSRQTNTVTLRSSTGLSRRNIVNHIDIVEEVTVLRLLVKSFFKTLQEILAVEVNLYQTLHSCVQVPTISEEEPLSSTRFIIVQAQSILCPLVTLFTALIVLPQEWLLKEIRQLTLSWIGSRRRVFPARRH